MSETVKYIWLIKHQKSHGWGGECEQEYGRRQHRESGTSTGLLEGRKEAMGREQNEPDLRGEDGCGQSRKQRGESGHGKETRPLPCLPWPLACLSRVSTLVYFTVDFKTYLQPKSWELYFIWWKFLGLQAWEAASHIILRNCSKEEKWEEPGYIEVLQQRAGNLNIKRLLLMKS